MMESGIFEDDERFVSVHKHIDAGDERMLHLRGQLIVFHSKLSILIYCDAFQISSRRSSRLNLHSL